MIPHLQSLPQDIRQAVAPLLDELPLTRAMPQLVVPQPPREGKRIVDVEKIMTDPAIATRPTLQAGLWLYIDELDRSHVVSQQHDDETGAYWHGIMHRREGDFGNSHHWFRKAGNHPAMQLVADVPAAECTEGGKADPGDYDPHELIDEVEAAHKAGVSLEELVVQQRREWVALFTWCAKQG